jgi:5-methylcytosine-specific restriction endonuclease McrA
LSVPSLTRFKRCNKCGCWKPAEPTFFHREKRHADGLRGECRVCRKLYKAQYRRAHREPISEYNRRYRENNPQAIAEYMRKYFKANRAQLSRRTLNSRQYKHRRRQRIQATMQEDCTEYMSVLRKDPCSYCGAAGGTIDHIVPLNEGGEHRADNLTASCHSCNSRKRTKSLLNFLLTN